MQGVGFRIVVLVLQGLALGVWALLSRACAPFPLAVQPSPNSIRIPLRNPKVWFSERIVMISRFSPITSLTLFRHAMSGQSCLVLAIWL